MTSNYLAQSRAWDNRKSHNTTPLVSAKQTEELSWWQKLLAVFVIACLSINIP